MNTSVDCSQSFRCYDFLGPVEYCKRLERGNAASSLGRILLKRYLSAFGGKHIGLSMKIEDICPCGKSPSVSRLLELKILLVLKWHSFNTQASSDMPYFLHYCHWHFLCLLYSSLPQFSWFHLQL